MTTEWSTAKTVTVSAGQYATGNDIAITYGASISGTVTNGTSGLEGVYVLATGLDASSRTQFTYTSSSGAYSLRGLSPGKYQICFRGYDIGYLPECYNGVEWSPGGPGEIFSVADQQAISNIDAVLSPGGGISGRVTNGSLGLGRVSVSVFDSNSEFVALAVTSYPIGSYFIGGLPSGSYSVCFNARTSGYIQQCFADPVQVTSPQTTTGIDMALAMGGSISGTVSDGSTGLSDVAVSALGGGWGVTNVWGEYIMRGLPSGTYDVTFNDYYRGYFPKTVSSVQVTSPGTTSGINAVLSMGASISGTVTDGTMGISGIKVSAYDGAGTFESGYTDSSGNYIIRRLPSGTYTVYFYDYMNRGYVTQYYSSSVQTTAPGTTTGIDAVLSTDGGSISGTVTNGTTGIGGVAVIVYDANMKWYGMIGTNPSGQYLIGGLPSGTYTVYFASGSVVQAFSGVVVVAPETTSFNAVFTSTSAKPSRSFWGSLF